MKISHRLYLTLLPAIIGLFTVAGLTYWGQYAHAIPHLLLVIAIVATIVSVILSWRSGRYVAQRVEQLAGTVGGEPSAAASFHGVASVLLPRRAGSAPDELDAIKGVVDQMSSAVVEAESTRAVREEAAERRVRDYSQMLEQVASASAARLEEVRLPLHILLENHFGDLNENQEEMLGAARGAAEAMDAELVALRQIAAIDLGTRELRRDRLLPGDIVRAIVPTLQATAEAAGVTLKVDIEPLLPPIYADQPMLHDALATLLGDAVRASHSGTELDLTLMREGAGSRIALNGAGVAATTVRHMLADRIIAASRGTVSRSGGSLDLVFTP